MLLGGDSFAGKSTLAYACARAGWTYVSDDATFVALRRDDRYAVGDQHSIRFRPDAPQLFPELSEYPLTIRPNGKIAIEVLTRELLLDTAPGCHVDHVVFLNREHPNHARVSLRPISKDLVWDDWSQYNVYGTQEVRQARSHCYERMLSAQLSQMQYSDLADAVARLERLVDQGVDHGV